MNVLDLCYYFDDLTLAYILQSSCFTDEDIDQVI